jgi:hypothetical protein
MALTPPAQPPPEPPARVAVRKLFLTPDEELHRRAAIHREGFALVWRSGTHTAAAFFSEAGTQGVLFMQVAGTNVAHIASVAVMIGKTLHDYLQPEDYVPPLAYSAHADGTITINPSNP